MTSPVDSLWIQARHALAQGSIAQAQAALEVMRAHEPHGARTHLLAAEIARREDRVRDAARHALDAARAAGDDPGWLSDAAESLWRSGEIVAMRECLAHPALANTRSGALLARLADFRQRLGENAEALALLDRAREVGVDGAALHFHRGQQLACVGRLVEAETEFETSLALAPGYGRAAIALARLRTQTRERNHLALFEQGLGAAAPGTRDHAAMEFARYKELEDLGRHDEAWQALVNGNAIMRVRSPRDAERQRRYLDAFITACTEQTLRAANVAHAGPQPIFIIGLTRSGTTLLERILGNHSRVESGGELGDFGRQLHWAADHASTQDEVFVDRLPQLDFAEVGRRYLAQTQWRARGKPFCTDKQPPNWMLAGLIRAALPQAKILHMVREPMDVCFSNWRAFFGNASTFSYDLTTLAAHYRDYRRLMAHWHAIMPGVILDVRYADLVRDPDTTARKVFDFCGIEWESDCLDLARNTAPVSTLSVAQVRDPIHARAFEEWRPYAQQLAGLRETLVDL